MTMRKKEQINVEAGEGKKTFLVPRIKKSGTLPVITAGSGDLGTPDQPETT
jgi:hypothetical protein